MAGPGQQQATAPPGHQPSRDAEAAVPGFSGSFGDKAIRQAFVRKVYSILSVQLLATVAFIAICIFM
jgi:FtsH-binding integral membrane protein